MWDKKRTQKFDTENVHILQSTLTVIRIENLEYLDRRDTWHERETRKVYKYFVWKKKETKVKSFSFTVILAYDGIQALFLSLASALGEGEKSASRLGRF